MLKFRFVGKHVINLFIQYTPYKPLDGSWEDPSYRVSRISTKHEFTYKFWLPCMELRILLIIGSSLSTLHWLVHYCPA